MEGKQIALGEYGVQPLKVNLKEGVMTDAPVAPFSFYDPKNFKAKEQKPDVPLYIPLNTLNAPENYSKEKMFSDFEEQKDGNLKLKNKDLKEKQKGVVTTIFKEAAHKIFEGKGIVGLSLPVRIFEPRSMIERICDLFNYSSHYLNRAAATDEPAERIKYIMGFVLAAAPHGICQYKPFNPLLGETYQATQADGTTIECEHISHHPPITAYYVNNPNFKIYGTFTINGEIHMNSVDGFYEGWGTVEFKDGSKYKFCLPNLSIYGLIMGSRGLQYTTCITVFHEASQTKGVLKYAADAKSGLTSLFSSSRSDVVRGQIYKYDVKKHQHILHKHKDKWLAMLKDLAEINDVAQPLHKVEGSWLREIRVDGELLWSLDQDVRFAQQHNYIANPLPSDCRFREDLIWLFRKNEDLAQLWKVKLEEQQRHERALRKKVNEARSLGDKTPSTK